LLILLTPHQLLLEAYTIKAFLHPLGPRLIVELIRVLLQIEADQGIAFRKLIVLTNGGTL